MKYHKGPDRYSDGDALEDDLARVFENNTPVADALLNDNRWPMLYHLSPERRNLLEWMKFGRNASLLEVGAGCGALTGLFCDRLSRVVAVEMSARRCSIIMRRHAGADCLEVAAADIMDYPEAEKFDYVTLIGVLEYARAFIGGCDAALVLLESLKRRLKPGGSLILAMENKFGMKYFAGAHEDHANIPFEGIEGYPRSGLAETFSRHGLENLLRRAGFARAEFYYPCPDYKLPVEIYSDRRLPAAGDPPPPGSLNFNADRLAGFDESAAMENAIAEGMFPFFANSFLVFASGGEAPSPSTVYARYNTHRLAKFQVQTSFELEGDRLAVVKRALSPLARPHIARIAALNESARSAVAGARLKLPAVIGVDADSVAFEFIEGPSMDSLMLKARRGGDAAEFRRLADEYRETIENSFAPVREFAPCAELREIFGADADLSPMAAERVFMKRAFLDPTPENLIRAGGGDWYFVDNEWGAGCPMPASYAIFRGMFSFFILKHASLGPSRFDDFGSELRRSGISEGMAGFYRGLEERFQDYVCGGKKENYIKLAYARPAMSAADSEQRRKNLEKLAQELVKTVSAQERELAEYRDGAKKLAATLESNDWRLLERLAPRLKKMFPPGSRRRRLLMKTLGRPAESLPAWLQTFNQKE